MAFKWNDHPLADQHSVEFDWNAHPVAEEDKPSFSMKGLARGAIDSLPIVGGIGGGILGAPAAGPIGSVGGAALGYAGGRELADILKNRLLGDKAASAEPIEQIKRVGGSLADGATMEMGGQAAGALLKGAGAATKNVLEDVATAPMTQPGAKMGMIPKALGAVGKAGNAFDDRAGSIIKSVAGTGNETVDRVLSEAAKKGSYMIPGIGKVIAAADAASAVPGIAQKGAQLALKGTQAIGKIPSALIDVASKEGIGKAAPNPMPNNSPAESFQPENIIRKAQGTKYASVLQNAAQRGPEAVRAASFVLQGKDPEYRKLMIGDEFRMGSETNED